MEDQSTIRKRFTPAEREAFLKGYRQSGLTQQAFVAQAGISLASLSKWLRRARSLKAPRGFVEIPALKPSAGAAGFKVEFPGGVKLEIARGFSPAEAEQLCRMLGQL